ncbi:MAG TPA: dihydrofolate reductase family protein [Ktedonobacteraceae bacterium]
MGKITTGFSMSLDGYVAGPQENFDLLFKWMNSGDTELKVPMGHGELELKVPEKSVHIFTEPQTKVGALVAGRRLYELTGGWGGRHPVDAPVVVVTHREPPEWVKADWPVTFVTDGLASALEQAKAIAGDKSVAVASTTLVQQCLKASLLDEIHIDLVPVLLGAGVRLFNQLDAPIELASTEVIESTGVTHLTFRVLK